MSYVFQTINKQTGKPHTLWRYQYTDYLGRQRKGTGAATRKETERIAAQVQAKQYSIRNGVIAAPRPSDKPLDIEPVFAEYLRWGRSQGGRRGRAWSPVHARKREQDLRFWLAELKLRTQFDLMDCQTRVERVISRLLKDEARSGKTAWNRVETLAAFGRWCVDRGYLADDPLRRLRKINTEPVNRRRALTAEEVGLLLKGCRPERRLLYRTAICTGLRANELRHITPALLDPWKCSIRLEAAWTKNRLDGYQPVPRWLMEELQAASEGLSPTTPIFSVPKDHASRMLRDDLALVGIPAFKPGEGVIVFHGLRMTFCSLLDECGASAKENQDLARHSTPSLTMNSYVRTRESRVRGVVDALGEVVQGPATTQQEPNGIFGAPSELPKAM